LILFAARAINLSCVFHGPCSKADLRRAMMAAAAAYAQAL